MLELYTTYTLSLSIHESVFTFPAIPPYNHLPLRPTALQPRLELAEHALNMGLNAGGERSLGELELGHVRARRAGAVPGEGGLQRGGVEGLEEARSGGAVVDAVAEGGEAWGLRSGLRGLVRVREGVEEGLASMMCAMVDWVSGADGGVYRMRVVDGLRGLELGERRRDGVVKSWARSKRLRA
jgi:hypothetical protein